MRKLGLGQSVVFLVPQEIETRLRTGRNAVKRGPITVQDVLVWSIHETWADIRHSIPIWATQGETFVRQQKIWRDAYNIQGPGLLHSLKNGAAERFLDDEAQSLEKRYLPATESSSVFPFQSSSSSSLASPQDPQDPQDAMLKRITDRCDEFQGLNINASSLQEEQERELSPETEQEREREIAPPSEPYDHKLSPQVREFARTGKKTQSMMMTAASSAGSAFHGAFEIFSNTTAAAYFDPRQWPRGLLVTDDFARTVKAADNGSLKSSSSSRMDNYQRDVQWLLVNNNKAHKSEDIVMVVLSSFEANALRKEMDCSSGSTLYLYAPRQNVGFAAVDDLRLYSVPGSQVGHEQIIPRNLVIELNLFAGQLYFDSYQEYTQVCSYLGLAWKAASDDGMVVSSDGFITKNKNSGDSRESGRVSSFKESPVQFLKTVLIKIRHNTEGIEKTHLGKVLSGAILTENDFVMSNVTS